MKTPPATRSVIYLIALFSVTVLLVRATVPQPPDPNELIGTWQVDLRPTPDAAPYYQSFTVTAIDGNTFTGTFYQSAIVEGRINTDWGAVYFAFTTDDGSGVYHTAGRLVEGRMEGTTHSLGRDFLAVWTAERTAEAK